MKNEIKKAAGILIYLIIGAVSGTLLNLLIMHSPIPEIFPSYTESIRGKMFSVNIISGLFLYCLVSPVLEELLFRRLIYDILYRYTGFAAAAVISSLIFAIFHMNMVQGIYAFIMGMLICTLYHRDHRIIVPVSLHIGANLAVWLCGNLLFGV